MANHYTSTHPDSRFTQLLIAQRMTTQARFTLRNRELTIDDGSAVTSRSLADDGEILRTLDDTFGLVFAPGTRFNFADPGAA